MYYFFSILYHIITVHRSLYLGRSFLTIGDIGWKMAILRILGIVQSKCSDYRMFEHSASFNDVRPYHHWSLALLPHSLPDVYTHVYLLYRIDKNAPALWNTAYCTWDKVYVSFTRGRFCASGSSANRHFCNA